MNKFIICLIAQDNKYFDTYVGSGAYRSRKNQFIFQAYRKEVIQQAS